jgi:hypothetical protein
MIQHKILGLVIVASGFALSGNAWSQQRSLKEQLVGTWDLVSVSEDYGGGKIVNSPFGPNVKGAASFDPNGNFLWMIIGANLPNPSGKPEESSTQVFADFGTYTADDTAHTVTYNIAKATIPAFDGHARTASVTVNGSEFTQMSAPISGAQGTFTPTLLFRRAKSMQKGRHGAAPHALPPCLWVELDHWVVLGDERSSLIGLEIADKIVLTTGSAGTLVSVMNWEG